MRQSLCAICEAARALHMCQLGQPKTLQACMRSGCSTGTGHISSLSCLRPCQPAVTILMLAQCGHGELPMVSCLGSLPAASSPPTALCLPDLAVLLQAGMAVQSQQRPPGPAGLCLPPGQRQHAHPLPGHRPDRLVRALACVSGCHNWAPVLFCSKQPCLMGCGADVLPKPGSMNRALEPL